MAHQCFEPESELRMSLNPADTSSSAMNRATNKKSPLDGVATIACSSSGGTFGVNLRVVIDHILPPVAQVDEGFASPVFTNGIGQSYRKMSEIRTRNKVEKPSLHCPKVVEPVGLIAMVKYPC